MNVRTILSALFILLMSATAMAQTKTADFKGSWSSEGDVSAKGWLDLEINQKGITFTGTASYKNYENNNQSGVCAISGKITGNKGAFTIVLNSRIMAKGTMTIDGNTIKFTSNTGTSFPRLAYAYRR